MVIFKPHERLRGALSKTMLLPHLLEDRGAGRAFANLQRSTSSYRFARIRGNSRDGGRAPFRADRQGGSFFRPTCGAELSSPLCLHRFHKRFRKDLNR